MAKPGEQVVTDGQLRIVGAKVQVGDKGKVAEDSAATRVVAHRPRPIRMKRRRVRDHPDKVAVVVVAGRIRIRKDIAN
jgi:hypothetical protein